MKPSMKVISVIGAVLLAVSGYGQVPSVSPMVITGGSQRYSLALSGYDFNSNLCSGSGDCAYFRIGDATCNKHHPGECEAGYLGDAFEVQFNSWAENQIEIGDYSVGQPCDAIEVGVWNSNNQADGAAWAGNIPGTNCGTPQIYSVVFSGSGANLHVTIYGNGFGREPSGIPCNNGWDTGFLRFGDYAYHSFTGECGVCLYAGFTGSSITMKYSSWTNTEIELTGFAGTYGQNGLEVHPGDPVTLDVWSTNGNGYLATAWSGRPP